MTDAPDLRPRRVVITGAVGEIGAHLARHFCHDGWMVLGIDKRAAAEGQFPPEIAFAECDLTDGMAAEQVLAALIARHGVPDVLINAAGLIANARLVSRDADGWVTHDFALWRSILDASLTAAFHTTAVTVKHMLAARQKGLIINVSSVCAQGNSGQAAYSAAKAGLDGFTRALSKELGPLGIRVTGLAPGYMDTRSMHDNVSDARLGKVIGAVPVRRLGTLAEVASAVDFLVQNEYVNGTILCLDGGLTL